MVVSKKVLSLRGSISDRGNHRLLHSVRNDSIKKKKFTLQAPAPKWMSFIAGVLAIVIVAQLLPSIFDPRFAEGAYTTSTTDTDGNTHLGSNTVNETYYYDTTQDSDSGTQQKLGVDPNWKNGVVRRSYALDFDGTTDFASVPDSSSLNLTTTFTVEGWIKRDSSGGNWSIFDPGGR